MLRYSQEKHYWQVACYETERFILKPLGARHEPGMFEMFSSADFTRYVPFEQFTDRAAARKDFLEKIAEGKRFKFHLAIEWKVPLEGEHNMAGFGMARPTEDGAHMEIGYCVVPRFWGQGIGTEVTRVLVDIVAPGLGAKKTDMIAKINQDNLGSIRVAEKCGFKVLKHVRDEKDPYLLLTWQG